MYAYHVTFYRNLAAIAKRGLVPGSKSSMGRGGYAGHSAGRVFLSDKEGVDFWYEKAEAAANDLSNFPLDDGLTPVVLRMPYPVAAWCDEAGSDDSLCKSWYVEKTLPSVIEVWDGSRWLHMGNWLSLDPTQAYQEGEEGVFKYQSQNPLAQIDSGLVRRGWRENASYLDRLLKHYGRTYSPMLGGFMLPDGGFLDFSEGSGSRSQDHRNITWVLPKNWEGPRDARWDGMVRVAKKVGMYRWMPETWAFDAWTSPTPAQMRGITELARHKPLIIEAEDGRRQFHEEFERHQAPYAAEVLRDFFRGEYP